MTAGVVSGAVTPAYLQFVDANGHPLAGGTVTHYLPNSTTPATTYSDPDLSVPNTNPIILDSAGRCRIFSDKPLRQILKDVNGTTIWDSIVITALSTAFLPAVVPDTLLYFNDAGILSTISYADLIQKLIDADLITALIDADLITALIDNGLITALIDADLITALIADGLVTALVDAGMGQALIDDGLIDLLIDAGLIDDLISAGVIDALIAAGLIDDLIDAGLIDDLIAAGLVAALIAAGLPVPGPAAGVYDMPFSTVEVTTCIPTGRTVNFAANFAGSSAYVFTPPAVVSAVYNLYYGSGGSETFIGSVTVNIAGNVTYATAGSAPVVVTGGPDCYIRSDPTGDPAGVNFTLAGTLS